MDAMRKIIREFADDAFEETGTRSRRDDSGPTVALKKAECPTPNPGLELQFRSIVLYRIFIEDWRLARGCDDCVAAYQMPFEYSNAFDVEILTAHFQVDLVSFIVTPAVPNPVIP